MSEHTEAQVKKLTFRRFKDGDHRWGSFADDIFQADHSHKCPTYVHRTPPCQGSCPSGEDIRGWLQIIRGIEKPPAGLSMQEYAWQRSTDANPFPSIMGRVCPAPCETGCNRNVVEDFVGINAVEQYIGDYAYKENFQFVAAPPLKSDKKVAIIGSGPAGLAAAYQLRRKGYASVLFEQHDQAGGMMRYGIPGYRTPRDVLDYEIKRIINLGDIELRTKVRAGQDISIEQLEAEFAAILWCVGCQSGRALPIPNGDAPNCVSGVKFLHAFNEGRLHVTADRIVCVGGGDTSIDVVSVARRLGKLEQLSAKDRPEHVIGGYVAHDVAFAAARSGAKVTLTSLHQRSAMIASEHEIEDAQREGVNIINSVMPVEVIVGDDGRATALRMAECVVDKDGKFEKQAGTEFDIECDLVVSAIGQGGDLSGLDAIDNGRGLVDVDAFYRLSKRDRHFAAGDIIRPHLLTTAIGQAAVAVDSITHYLENGELNKRPKVDVHHFDLLNKLRESNLEPSEFSGGQHRGTDTAAFSVHNYEDRSRHEVVTSEKLFLGHFSYTPRIQRQGRGPEQDAVLGNFEERVVGLSDEQAVEEANRCMSCGMCFECDNCVIFCPQDAVFRVKKDKSTTGRYVDTDYNKCIGCHICADVCPTGYIDMALGDH